MVSVVVAGSYERAQYVVETAVEPVPGPLSSQHLHEFCGALHLFHCVDCYMGHNRLVVQPRHH